MMIQVYAKRVLPRRKDEFVAELEGPLDILSLVGDDDSFSSKIHCFQRLNTLTNFTIDTIVYDLYKKQKNGKRGSIKLRLDVSGVKSGHAIRAANQGIKNISGSEAAFEVVDGVNERVNKGVETMKSINDLWGPLLNNFSEFMKVVDQLADVSDIYSINFLSKH
jgi:hypothetical protein